ncbi:uncharacterized protein LOC6050686 isoform X3 [Culex quinquefasciatus]|uniref:uncharacterized protein LOC6050686 isoform X3 n=1 Tax=Culex quinquefasciatus TaxID=7176 RepID=UPI0018E39989|nr:uncharacterized protein LOC6050686 isoform X3 [Culex quinquefasciatus]
MQSLNETHRIISAQSKFYNSYEGLINHILVFYVVELFTVCRISSNKSSLLSRTPGPSILLTLDSTSEDDQLLMGIELGCNVFVVEQEFVEAFLDRFVHAHDQATYRYTNKTVLLLLDPYRPESLNQVAVHYALDEIKNLLVFEPNELNHTINLRKKRWISKKQGFDLPLWKRFDLLNVPSLEDVLSLSGESTNLFGKSIRFATFNVIPHIIFEETNDVTFPIIRHSNKTYTLDGLDGLFVVEFCKRLNCTVELILDEVNMWGTIHENKTGNGVMGSVIERKADVGACAMSSWFHSIKHLRFSKAFLRGGVTCLTPKPEYVL